MTIKIKEKIEKIQQIKKELRLEGKRLFAIKTQKELEYQKALEDWKKVSNAYNKLDYQENLLKVKLTPPKQAKKSTGITKDPKALAEALLKNLKPEQRVIVLSSLTTLRKEKT